MKDPIERQDAIDAVHKLIFDFFDICDDDEESPMTYKDEQLLELNKAITTLIKALPSAQPDREYIGQIKWERDTAIQQLKELGYGFGEKIRTDVDTISRQAAIDGVKTLHEVAWKNWHKPTLSANVVIDMIKGLPSAQPEIIRCKDCKWGDWYTAIDGNRYCYCMETGNGGMTEDDYCSYAERLEE